MSCLPARIGLAALACWLGVLAHPARPWDLRPRDDGPEPAEPPRWPEVAVVVPARNEAAALPETLPALLDQDYPGPWRLVLVDDRSDDGTAALAGAIARARGRGGRLRVVTGRPLPAGWIGKVWALEQGRAAAQEAGDPSHLLLTDADIRHGPDSLRRLVAQSLAEDLALDSRMARLRCVSPAERLLVPAFVLFFNLLYPMRWANRPGRRPAAAAGGCILVRARDLAAAGGLGAIRDALIDDLALAHRIARTGGRTRLELSTGRVASVRRYGAVGPLWRMVRRSAFTQLRRSWALLAAAELVLALMFAGPPLAVGAALAGPPGGRRSALAAGAAGWAAMAAVGAPAGRLYGQGARWGLRLPLVGALYAAMTLDSALRGPGRAAGGWR